MCKVFFGGSFDPIHLGHLIVARDVVEFLKVEKLIFIPTFQAPLKEPHEASPEQRYKMIELAIEGEPHFEVSNVEIKRGGVSYTVDTARELFKTLGEKPTFLLGADSTLSLHMWKEAQKLIQIIRLVIVDRNNRAKEVLEYLKNTFPHMKEDEDCIVVPSRNIDISSTEIRKRVKEGKSIKWLVPEGVERYILENKLYRETTGLKSAGFTV